MAERRNWGKAKVGASNSEGLRPGSRYLQPKALCFTKVIDSNAIDPERARLHLEPPEVNALVVCDEIVEHREGVSIRTLKVYDVEDRLYDIELKGYIIGKLVNYSLAVGWEKFVDDHNLGVGDEVTFYKNRDARVSDDEYIILKVKKNAICYDVGDSVGVKWNVRKPRTMHRPV